MSARSGRIPNNARGGRTARVSAGALRIIVLAIAAGMLLATADAAGASSNLVNNGSLENRSGGWTNTRCNYMSVRPGSKLITGWKATAAQGELAWAKGPTCDGYRATKGRFFVDLTGFGADAPNGALQQRLQTRAGKRYKFSIDVCGCNDAVPSVTLGGQTLSLAPGRSFAVGTTSWRHLLGSFTGNAHKPNPELKIMNATPGAQIVFIDNVVIRGQ
jgi:hypothetical protein